MSLINLSAAEPRELRRLNDLGPYLGVFYGMPQPGLPRFGHGGDLFRLLTRLSPGRGLFTYVFTPESLVPAETLAKVTKGTAYSTGADADAAATDSTSGAATGLAPQVAGWFHDGREWTRALFPWPDVLYDRSIADTDADNRILAWARSQFPPGLPALNSWPLVLGVEDKWLTNSVFASVPEARPFLPAMSLCRSMADVRDMLWRHGAVVLKERYGHKARRVAFVRREDETAAGIASPGSVPHGATAVEAAPRFAYVRDAGGRRQDRAAGLTWAGLAAVLEAHVAGGEFLVQQAIDRARFQGRHIELRVVMHKAVDHAPAAPTAPCHGRWLRTGMVCRLTDPDLPFLALGRELDLRPSAVLPAVFGTRRAEELLDQVRSLVRLVNVLEERTGPGAELAMDFMIDARAHPWLLEVNTRPAMLLKATESEHLRRQGALRLLEYARCLVETS